MPIEENKMRYEQRDQMTKANDDEEKLNIIPPKLKKQFVRRFEPKEIINYYDHVYHRNRTSNCRFFKCNEHNDLNRDEDMNSMICTCNSGSGTKRYFTAPYNHAMREKYNCEKRKFKLKIFEV